MKKVLIVGATSAIAEATAREYAREGAALALAGRGTDRLEAIAADLRLRGAARVCVLPFEATDIDAHEAFVQQAEAALEGLDVALLAWGTLPDPERVHRPGPEAMQAIQVNGTAVVSLSGHIARRLLERREDGRLAVISSVAGDRGRASNYVYGAAKALVSTYLSGLRQSLWPTGVRVVTIKPGFVDTPMTAAFPKGPLWASPATVGRQIHRAIRNGTPVAYTPGFWRGIMFIIKALPEWLFVRRSL